MLHRAVPKSGPRCELPISHTNNDTQDMDCSQCQSPCISCKLQGDRRRSNPRPSEPQVDDQGSRAGRGEAPARAGAVRPRSRSSLEKTGDGVIWTECSSRMKAEETRNGQAGYRLRRHLARRREGDVSKGRPQVTNVLSFGKRVRAGDREDL